MMAIPTLELNTTALFTDFDGTLVDLADTPDGIAVAADLPALLCDLASATEGALALVTGRALANLHRHLDLDRHSAAGAHGAEWQVAGLAQDGGAGLDALAELRSPLTAYAAQHGLLIEDKGAAIALHTRARPQIEPELDRFLAQALVGHEGLTLVRGKCIRELRPVDCHKGAAIARFMELSPFAGRTPWYFGDDTTDEDGFAEVNARNGVSIKIGEGETAARYRLPDPAAVRAFLRDALQRRD